MTYVCIFCSVGTLFLNIVWHNAFLLHRNGKIKSCIFQCFVNFLALKNVMKEKSSITWLYKFYLIFWISIMIQNISVLYVYVFHIILKANVNIFCTFSAWCFKYNCMFYFCELGEINIFVILIFQLEVQVFLWTFLRGSGLYKNFLFPLFLNGLCLIHFHFDRREFEIVILRPCCFIDSTF